MGLSNRWVKGKAMAMALTVLAASAGGYVLPAPVMQVMAEESQGELLLGDGQEVWQEQDWAAEDAAVMDAAPAQDAAQPEVTVDEGMDAQVLGEDELLGLFGDVEDSYPADAGDGSGENSTNVINAPADDAPTLEAVLESERQQEEARRAQLEESLALEDGRPLLTPADTDSLAGWLDLLLQTPSPTGSDGELIVGRSIASAMEEMGYTVTEQNFHEGVLNEDGIDPPGLNIIAERGADSEERTGDILVLCAHYDSKTNPLSGDPFAEDKTGAAVLLEMARIFSQEFLNIDLCFVFLSGEEDGWYGSDYFAKFLERSALERVKYAISVERAGYCLVGDEQTGSGDEPLTYRVLTKGAEETYVGSLARREGLYTQAEQLLEADREAQAEAEALEEAAQAGLDVSEGAGSAAALEALLLREDWNYLEDTGSSAAALAGVGIDAAAVTQEIPEELMSYFVMQKKPGETVEGETEQGASAEVYIDLDLLAQTTDILAAAMGRIIV